MSSFSLHYSPPSFESKISDPLSSIWLKTSCTDASSIGPFGVPQQLPYSTLLYKFQSASVEVWTGFSFLFYCYLRSYFCRPLLNFSNLIVYFLILNIRISPIAFSLNPINAKVIGSIFGIPLKVSLDTSIIIRKMQRTIPILSNLYLLRLLISVRTRA